MIEERYDQVRQLINMGKERGYLLYDEVNDILPAEVHSSEEIDDLLSTLERYGIDIYEDVSSAKAARAVAEAPESGEAEPKEEGPAEEADLDLPPGALEKTNDPGRMYLREMGTAPPLTRAGEVAIAKRIEWGLLVVLDRKSTRLNSSHGYISYAVFCLKKKKRQAPHDGQLMTL